MKLFKNVRKVLIREGNLKRYLLYAVGEILLVMIGISLAFQVNNWNDNRIKQLSEIRYYENIRDQILDDRGLILWMMEINRAFMIQFEYAAEIIETNDQGKMDTLGLIILNLTQYSEYDRQGNIYETMVNSGEIKILHNLEIINSVRHLEEKYLYVNRMENIHYEAMMTYVVPTINANIKLSNGQIQKPDLFYNYEFQNLILSLLQIMEEKDKVYNEVISEIDIITDLINQEL